MANELAIVLCSGGDHSLVTAALAGQRHRLVMLHAERNEQPVEARTAFERQVEHFKPERSQTLIFPAAPPTTPGNAVRDRCVDLLPLMGVGARLAAKADAIALYLGMRIGSTDGLADAMEFVQLWSDLLENACGNGRCTVEAPLLDLNEKQVRELAEQIDAPLALAAKDA